ncbi:hypothetical protein C8J57DRAFT_1609827 [Mycena rebaudengoi]|nr:hypothetical protein C8J57DRAFT_1609827 [Mycena rebaudengoi]
MRLVQYNPLQPAQTRAAKLTPPSLRHLKFWGWFALCFVVISALCVLAYAVYNCYRALTANSETQLPRYSYLKAKRIKKNGWHHVTDSGCSQQQSMLSDKSMEYDRGYNLDNSSRSHTPFFHADVSRLPNLLPVLIPSPAVSAPARSRTVPTYDTHNIRFASPSNVTIYNNPKLAPVQGSAVPLVYESRDNLFVSANPFTPTKVSRNTGNAASSRAEFKLFFCGSISP